ncbi:hypothetical protein GSD1FS_1960 [Bifidobacterium sp. GSD1FS]|uniref:Uncharacterized protein n=1 Tax=Bifidobacterium canis TaxID=2610880 RepID=A0A7K1J7D6_9BIFI|nr:hypothetical protein [Bifidobacterium canis]
MAPFAYQDWKATHTGSTPVQSTIQTRRTAGFLLSETGQTKGTPR